jgi:excinuclease ABC subunit C
MPIYFSTIRDIIPQTPGVYFFRNSKKEILYIGKAANIRSRLSSYFVSSAVLSAAKKRMLLEAEYITWQDTPSEIEALIVEANLIKKHLPPYNIVMRDDKQYLFVGFTREPFPRIIFTHQPIQVIHSLPTSQVGKHKVVRKKKIDYIGPFTEAGAVKRLLRLLRKAFSYCTCKKPHTRFCQQAELNLCMGFCCVKNHIASTEERAIYQKNIRYIKSILTGRQQQLLKRLRIEMNRVSKLQLFEKAAILRDQVHALERVFAHQHTLKKDYEVENQKGLHELKMLLSLKKYPKRIEGYDISNIQGNFAVGSMVVFTDGVADKQAYRKFRIRTVKGANDTAMMREVLRRRFTHHDWPLPDIILIDGGKGQRNAACSAIENTVAKNLIVLSIAKREEELYTAKRNNPFKLKEMPTALLYLLQQIRNEAHRFAISYYRKRHRKSTRTAL